MLVVPTPPPPLVRAPPVAAVSAETVEAAVEARVDLVATVEAPVVAGRVLGSTVTDAGRGSQEEDKWNDPR